MIAMVREQESVTQDRLGNVKAPILPSGSFSRIVIHAAAFDISAKTVFEKFGYLGTIVLNDVAPANIATP